MQRNLTPKQRVAAGLVAACCAIGAPLIATHEGRVNTVYPDVVLKWAAPTVCTGHMDPTLQKGQTFTDVECDQMLAADLTKYYDGMAKDSCIGNVPVSDNELAAMLSLSFNVGTTAFCQSSIPGKLKRGDHSAACATIIDFRFVGGKDCAISANNCRGIVRRREAERKLCETPV